MFRFIKLAAAFALMALPALADEPAPVSPMTRALDTELQGCVVTSVNRLAKVAELQDQVAALQKQLADKEKPADKK